MEPAMPSASYFDAKLPSRLVRGRHPAPGLANIPMQAQPGGEPGTLQGYGRYLVLSVSVGIDLEHRPTAGRQLIGDRIDSRLGDPSGFRLDYQSHIFGTQLGSVDLLRLEEQ